MWPLAVGQIAGSIVGGAASYAGQKAANESNERIARENREFQEQMSSSAWQRGVMDMKAAGLNPMVAYSKGPASSPAGSTAKMENPLGAAPGVMAQISSAFQLLKMKRELQLLDAEAGLKNDQGRLVQEQANKTQVEYNALAMQDPETGHSMAYLLRKAELGDIRARRRLNEIRYEIEAHHRGAAKVEGSEMAGWIRLLGPQARTILQALLGAGYLKKTGAPDAPKTPIGFDRR